MILAQWRSAPTSTMYTPFYMSISMFFYIFLSIYIYFYVSIHVHIYNYNYIYIYSDGSKSVHEGATSGDFGSGSCQRYHKRRFGWRGKGDVDPCTNEPSLLARYCLQLLLNVNPRHPRPETHQKRKIDTLAQNTYAELIPGNNCSCIIKYFLKTN